MNEPAARIEHAMHLEHLEKLEHPLQNRILARLPISPMEIVASSLTIGLLLYINEMVLDRAHEPMFVAPFAASIVILFIVPGMSWLRSWAVIGGQLLPSAIALGVDTLMPDHDIVASMIVIALSLIAMRLARCMHPPGVATALLIVASTDQLGTSFLFFPVLFGSCVVVASAWLVYAIERKLPARWGGRIKTATSEATS